jgi:hypothetical protein
MMYRDRGPAGRAPRAEPSWPTVIATTIRLWLERHPVVIGGRAFHIRPRVLAVTLTIWVAAGVLAAGIAGALVGGAGGRTVISTTSRSTTSRGSSPVAAAALSASAATRDQAARWIATQVATSAIVACDPAMCAVLEANGVPAARLLMLGTAAADPLGSDVVVATLAVRNQFGSRLESVYAPTVIASFGQGAGRIDVRAIAPLGAAPYESALAADLRARMAAGSQFLRNPRIALPASAKAALAAGEVDSRLLITLAALAAEQPVRVVAFDDASPGASPAVPLRGVEIAPMAGGAQATASLQLMRSFLDAQRSPFLPLRISLDGSSDLNVEYAAPSALGLLGTP